MDLIKIGKYIAIKRKALGLTQRQVAEKLGMSDKSISKWERGICLPDVSVYADLCEILQISINEFLAGEDIEKENIVQKSEENIISISTAGKNKQKRLKIIMGVLIAVCIAVVAFVSVMIFNESRPENYIEPFASDSAEMKTVQMLSGVDGGFLYRFVTTKEHSEMDVFVSEYRSGKLVNKDKYTFPPADNGNPNSGTILIMPDFEKFQVKLIIADTQAKIETEIPILKNEKEKDTFARTALPIDAKTDITYNKEQGMLIMYCGRNEVSAVSLSELEGENMEVPADNDYAYYFSVKFCDK